jgi:hypothetical protein
VSSQSKYIPMTIRLENSLYIRFRDKVQSNGATRVGIIRLLIASYLEESMQHNRRDCRTKPKTS